MRLITLALLSFLTVLTARPQTITVQRPDAAGLELIGAQSPDFQKSVQQVLGAAGLQGLAEWQAFAVVLKNNSSQLPIGYMLHWGANGGRGATGTV
jgi:hypothetical protein